MRGVPRIIYFFISVVYLFYLLLPAPPFPKPLSNSIKSYEPGDMEDPMRQAYYTNMNREDVINFYRNEFLKSPFLGIPFITFRLNYPPEEAQTLIRDQTPSSFLEELAHPNREFLFINGYEPPKDRNPLVVEGRFWKQKVTIKYVVSSPILRFLLGIVSSILLFVVLFEWKRLFYLIIRK